MGVKMGVKVYGAKTRTHGGTGKGHSDTHDGKNIGRDDNELQKVGRARAEYIEGEARKSEKNSVGKKSQGQAFVNVEFGHESDSGSKHDELCETAKRIYDTAVENRGEEDGHGDHGLQNR